MLQDKGYLLDLIARRYPGTRPSDLYGLKSENNPKGLDEIEAFEFDAALAYRYSLKERDRELATVHEITEAVRLTGRYHGIKSLRYKPYKSSTDIIEESDEADDVAEGQNDDGVIILTKGAVIDNGTLPGLNI